MARLLGVLFMRENWGEVPFLAEGKNKDFPPEWAPSQNPARSTLGTRVRHMSGSPPKRGCESICLAPLRGVLNHAASPTCKAVFDFLGGRYGYF